MGIKEAWRGTPEDQTAIETVQLLGRKSSLSKQDRVALKESQARIKQLTRRRFLILGGGAAALTTSGIGLNFLLQKNSQGNEDHAEEDAHTLFAKNGPDIRESDGRNAIVQASAEFFTNNAISNYSAQELARRTTYVPTKDEYVKIALAKGNISFENNLPDQSALTEYGNSSIAQTSQEGEVFLNKQGIEEDIPQYISAYPLAAIEGKNGNLAAEVVNYALLHEYGHVSETRKAIPFSAPLTLNFDNGSLIILGISGLRLNVIPPESNAQRELQSNEALIDAQAFALCEKAGNPIAQFQHNSYDTGRAYVNMLNQASGIDTAALSSIIAGRSSILDLLHAWGNTSVFGASNAARTSQDQLKNGVLALAIVGAVSEGWMSQETSLNAMHTIFQSK